MYKGKPEINFGRLNEIASSLEILLVLHGSSSSGDNNLKHCANEGISKINIFSDIVNAAMIKINETKPTN